MRVLLKLLLLAAIGLPLAAVAALSMCFQPAPLVVNKAEISPADVENAKRLLQKHDPRKAKAGTMRAVVASQHEVDLLLNYAASRYRRASTRVELRPGTAIVQASLEVPRSPFGPWLNVDGRLRETGGLPTFERLRIGSLPVPGFVADFAVARLAAHFGSTDEVKLATDVVKRVTLLDSRLQVIYEWRDDIPDRLRAVIVPPADQDRLKAYSDRLVEITAKAGSTQSISLAQLLPPMFALAEQRTGAGDAAKENRAAIVTLAFYKKRYGGVGAPAYNKMMANIEARVASRALFR